MTTFCMILRTNRTLGKIKVKDNQDDFKFEEGLYFIQREKVFLNKVGWIRKKIRPTLLYMEGVSQPLYLDNLKIKEYYEDVPILDEKGKPIKNEDGTFKTENKLVKKLEDIFIDARAIHNMVAKKILSVLSASDDMEIKDYVILILLIVSIVLIIISMFV